MPRAPASQVTRGILLMVLAVFMFTIMDATAKGLIQRYPAQQVIFARFAVMGLLILCILRGRVPALLRTNHPWLHLARAAGQFGATGLFFLSLGHIGLAEATALTDSNPVLIAVGAALFLGERLGPHRIFGVILAMVGALIVIRPGFGVFSPWALLPIGAAFFYTAAALLTRLLGSRESAWTSMLYSAAFGVVASALTAPTWVPVAPADLPIFLGVGILGTVALLAIIRSFSITEASVVAPFAYLGIVFATLWGILFFDEWPDLPTILGALVIVGAGLYVWHRENLAARRAA